jgi:hypothetical protein
MLVCPDALVLNKVGSANKHRNEDLLVHTYLDEATAQKFIEHLTSVNEPMQPFPALHTTASRNLYALLENN